VFAQVLAATVYNCFMKNSILLPGIVTILFFSCDGPYKNCPDHYFSEEFKSYTSFSSGSYWIYQDTLNNVVDSICLMSGEIKFKEDCDYHGDPQEILNQSFYSSFFSPDEINISCEAAFPIYYENNWLGFFRDDLMIGESMDFTYEAKFDSLLINEKFYKEVMVFTKDNDFKYYWAKGIGLVKKVFPYPDNSDTIYDFEIVKYKLN
jgi:hypothetical protein